MSAAAANIVSIGAYRQARPEDVNRADLSPVARAVYRDFCTSHINPKSNNTAWPKTATQASRLGVSVRTVTRARNELLEKHWICLPSGDSGGRAFSKETWLEPRGQAVRIHLHPDGQPCGMQQSELKQRVAASRRMAGKGDNLSPLFTLAKDDNLSGKGDNLSNAYKEGTSPTGTPPTTTSAPEATETAAAAAVAAADREHPESPISRPNQEPECKKSRTPNAKVETSENAGSEGKTSHPENPVSALDAADSPTTATPRPAATEVRRDRATPDSKERKKADADPIEYTAARPVATPLPEHPLVQQLTKRGVSEKKARELLANLKPGQEAMDQLAYVDSLIDRDRRGKFENPPGLYVVYVRDNIAPATEFCSTRKARLHQQAENADGQQAAREARDAQAERLRKEAEADLANPNIPEEEKRLIRTCLGLDDPRRSNRIETASRGAELLRLSDAQTRQRKEGGQ